MREKMMRFITDYLWEDFEMGLADSMVHHSWLSCVLLLTSEYCQSIGCYQVFQTARPHVVRRCSRLWLRNNYKWFESGWGYLEVQILSSFSLLLIPRNVFQSDPHVPMSEVFKLVKYVREMQVLIVMEIRALTWRLNFTPCPTKNS